MDINGAKHIANTIIRMYHLDGTGSYGYGDERDEPLVGERYDSIFEDGWNGCRPAVRDEGDGSLSIILEAPAHAAVEVFTQVPDDPDADVIVRMMADIHAAVRDFDAEGYFTGLWDAGFAREHNLHVIQLAAAIERDGDFLNRAAEEMDECDIEEYLRSHPDDGDEDGER